MVFNATFNNISVISWRSVLLVSKTIKIHNSSTDNNSFKSKNKLFIFVNGFLSIYVKINTYIVFIKWSYKTSCLWLILFLELFRQTDIYFSILFLVVQCSTK
jgi:hypothetical protein